MLNDIFVTEEVRRKNIRRTSSVTVYLCVEWQSQYLYGFTFS